MSRQRNSLNNLIWGMVGTLITSIVAIIIPRLFIVNYGSEINGLLSSIKQVYVYLALLEIGVGDASVVALYSPIAHNNYDEANGILSATNHYYKKIGIVYGICVLLLGLIYPLLVKSNISFITCFLIIVLQGSGSVISYLVQGKYNMLLRVDNRNYVTTNLSTVTSVFTDVTRIILLMNGKSIIAVQSTYLVFNIIKMGYVSWYIKRNYKWLDLSVKPNFKAISQRGAVFMHQISSLVFSHTDVLILTFVCGLKTVSIYSMYAMIYGFLDTLITTVSSSVQSALGQVFHLSKERYLEINEAFETYYLSLVFSLIAIASVFILPFMKLYTRGADINYVDWRLPVLFGIYQLLSYGRVSSNFIIGFAGEFKATQWRAWLETIINLVVSFVCVFKFGIYGVLFGTITALIYRANDIILFANHRILKRSAKSTYRKWFVDVILFCISVGLFLCIPMRLNSYLYLLLNAVWVSICVVILFFGINTLVEKKARAVAIYYIKNIMSRLKMKRG